MKRLVLAAIPILSIVSSGASAASSSASGSGALALAALIAAQSPVLSLAHRNAMSRMLDGHLNFTLQHPVFDVTATGVTCRTSDVDITLHTCDIAFGTHHRMLSGRVAHELFATLVELGVPGDGAAGSIYESLSHLSCHINTTEVKQKGGGGASCTFTPGSP